MIRHRFAAPILFLFAMALFPEASQSQELGRVWHFSPKQGHVAAFQEAFRAHMDFRAEQGDPWSWWVYQVVVGENSGDFYAASWNHEWADLDAYDAWEGVEILSSHFQGTVAPLLEASSNTISQGNPEMRKVPDDPSWEPTLISITTFYLIPGKQQAFNENLMKIHEAIVEADMPFYYTSSFNAAGGDGPTFTIAGLSETWAEFADPDPSMEQIMVEKYGEEEAMEIWTAFGEAIHHWESEVVRYRPDLSNVEGM